MSSTSELILRDLELVMITRALSLPSNLDLGARPEHPHRAL